MVEEADTVAYSNAARDAALTTRTTDIDVEVQCGVSTPSGSSSDKCSRGHTCKKHSMGAKRAVPGRSAPYDHLLNAYQEQKRQEREAEEAGWIYLDHQEVRRDLSRLLGAFQADHSASMATT